MAVDTAPEVHEPAPPETPSPQRSRVRRAFARLSRPGLFVGSLLFAASLQPSLLPRTPLIQGVVSGISVALGYGVGTGIHALWRYLQIPPLRGRWRSGFRWLAIALATAAVTLSTWQNVGWQNELRELFGMPPTSWTGWPTSVIVTLVVGVLLLLIARGLRWLFRLVIGWFRHVLPPRLATTAGVISVVALLWLVASGLLVRGFWAGASAVFAPGNDVNKPGISAPPTSGLRSGSSESLVSWDSLGREGRAFVASGPTVDDLEKVSPDVPADEPIRVFVGLESADTVEERAQLVLDELKRTDAFDRKVLVLATTTGSGFIDPGSADSFEYLWHGDTAIAGMQYSYLPSWLSLLADQQNVLDASQATFQTVYSYLRTLPEKDRPKVYVYGLSLGSFGAQSVLTSIQMLNDPIDGALLVGPPFLNPLHTRLTAERDPGSPPWRPVYQEGQTVRFTAQEPVLESQPSGPWGPTRIGYVQHGSDPVVWFSPDLLLQSPEWLEDGQRAPDVSPQFTWSAGVTMWQVLFDLTAAGSVPWGYGHRYPASENLPAWDAVSQPPGWTQQEITELGQQLDADLNETGG